MGPRWRLGSTRVLVLASVVIVVAGVAAVVIAGGGGDGHEGVSSGSVDEVTNVSIVEPNEVPRSLLDDQALGSHPPGSPERAFLRWWQQLQFHSWAGAIAGLDPGVRATIGGDTLVQGLEIYTAWYPTVQPRVLDSPAKAGGVVVLYAVGSPDGKGIDSESALLLDTPDGWRVLTDSTLIRAVRAGVERAVTVAEDPTAQTTSEEGLRAGQRTASKIAAYITRRLGD